MAAAGAVVAGTLALLEERLEPGISMLELSQVALRFDAIANRNKLVTLVGNADGAIRVSQDVKISRLVSDTRVAVEYLPSSTDHGVYVFVLEGSAACAGTSLRRRDSKGIWGAESISLQTDSQESDLLIVESSPCP